MHSQIERNTHTQILTILGFAYPIGKVIQVFPQMPEFLRFYLADFGFVPSIAAGVWFLSYYIDGPHLPIRRFTHCTWAVGSCTILAIFFEALQHRIGRGDLLDMGMYMVGMVVSLELLKKALKRASLQQFADTEPNRPPVPEPHIPEPAAKQNRAQRRSKLPQKNRLRK